MPNEPDFKKLETLHNQALEQELIKSLVSFSATDITVCYVSNGHFRIHFSYKNHNWTIATNSTAQKYNLGFGHANNNNYSSGGYYSHLSPTDDTYWFTQSYTFKIVFEKIEKAIKELDKKKK